MPGATASLALASLVLLLALDAAAGDQPDRDLKPGAANSAIAEQDYRARCHTKGWTKQYRPQASFTNSLKHLQMKEYGYAGRDPRDYEEDHLIPLCLAGAPQDPANLWPQHRFGEWSADRKDQLEAKLCRLACDGRVPLRQAQSEIADDWIGAYNKYVTTGHSRRQQLEPSK
jgi:hypothetical protein